MAFSETIVALEVQTILWILLIVSVVSVIVRRIKMPYTLGLIFAGLTISVLKVPLGITLTPELLFFIFLPGLLFEGAMNIDTEQLFRNIKAISLFAVFGLLLSVFAAGSVFHYVLGVPWEISFLFAAMIAPTDPIAVLAIFKRLGVSKRLAVLLEGESLFNDGTGIVLFGLFLSLITTGTFSFRDGVLEFFKLVFGALILGVVIGYLASKVMKGLKDSLIKLTLTTVLAYGSFLVAEELHFSGVIATVTAGLVMGGYGLRYLSATTKLQISSFWSYLGFILNSIVFLLIGLEIEVTDLLGNIYPVAMAFASIIIGRAVAVYILSLAINKIDDSKIISGVDEHIPFNWQHVIVWGGLHGGLSMVLALSLPFGQSQILDYWRPFLLTTVFGTVFLSLVFQGVTMAPLLTWLNLSKKKKKSHEYETEVAKLIMYEVSEKELKRMKDSKIVSAKIYNELRKEYSGKKLSAEKKITEMLRKNPHIEAEQLKEVESSILNAQKLALIQGNRKGLFSEDTLESYLKEINEKLFEMQKE
ncbi:Na+/H+ antiporter [Candidatus Woesearchaeota archaeon]|nr:Na+/H+ antiporter [Candidatus Woesearchaeota archaeon]